MGHGQRWRRILRVAGMLGLAGSTGLTGAGVAPLPVARAGAAPGDVVPTEGTATFTDLAGAGSCSFLGEPADNLHVGLSSQEYGTADVCGAYLDVTGPRGTVRVKVTDHCLRCPSGVIDVTRTAFAQIAEVDDGRAPVSYRLVRNPPLAEPIALRVKAGSSASWLQVQVLDHGNALAGFEVATDGGGWRQLVRTADNFWLARNPGAGEGPFRVRVVDIYGQSAVIDGVALAPDQVQVTGARLYAPEPVAATTTSPTPATSLAPGPSTPTPGSPGETSSEQVSRPLDREPAQARDGGGGDGGGGSIVPVFVVLAAGALAGRAVVAWRRRRSGHGSRAIDRWPRRWPGPS